MAQKASYGALAGGPPPPRTRTSPVPPPRRAEPGRFDLQPRPDLNWRFRLERAASLASRRRGRCMAAASRPLGREDSNPY